MRATSLQTRLTVVLFLLLVVPMVLAASIGYMELFRTIRDNSIRTVGQVADMRHTQLAQRLRFENQRTTFFLQQISRSCKAGQDCLRDALQLYIKSEGALGGTLFNSNGAIVVAGESNEEIRTIPVFKPKQLAQFSSRESGRQRTYFVLANDEASGLQLAITFPIEIIQSIFESHPNLGQSGETFLSDHEGYFITKARYKSSQGVSHPISATPMQRCLKPEDGETLDLDYRDVPIIHGFHFVPEIGGGCIMAHIDQAEAFLPLKRLRWIFAVFLITVPLLSIWFAMALARNVASPIRKLADVSKALASGNKTARADEEGFEELAMLGSAFNEMTNKLAEANADLERKVQERTTSLRLMSNAYENSNDAILISDFNNRILTVNPAFTRTFGYALDEVVGQDPKMLSAGRTPANVYLEIWSDMSQKDYWAGELLNRGKDGKVFSKWVSISAIRDEQRNVVNYVAIYTDVSKLKESEQRMQHLAHHDALTGLPNRLMLVSRLDHAIERSRRNAGQIAVLFFDLDHFKQVNDTFGHKAGDELLIAVANRLQERLREVDTIARLGGDEFVIILEDISDTDAPIKVAQELIHQLSMPFPLSDGNIANIGASIGISLFPADGSSADQLIERADRALYEAKKAGRGIYRFFNRTGEI